MTTYYLTYAGLLFARIIGGASATVRFYLYWVSLVCLFVFSGFRYEVGCDWGGYLVNFITQSSRSFTDAINDRDPGHWALIDLIQTAGLPYPYLNIVTSAVFFLGLHVLARRQPNPLAFLVLAFPILIINMPMSGIRQGVAIGFVTMGFVAFIDRRLVTYIALVGIGCLFHASAAIFFLLVPFIHGRYSRKNLLLASVLALPGAYFLMQSDAAEIATSRYVGTGNDAVGAAYRLMLLALTGGFYMVYIKRRWERIFPGDAKLASLGALMMIGSVGLYFVSSVIGDRLGYYLIPLQLMIFARLPYLSRDPNRPFVTLAPYAVLTLVFLVWTQFSWHFNHCYIPYRTLLLLPS